MGIGSLPKEEHDALGLTMRHHAFIVLMLAKSCPQQVLSPASQDNMMLHNVLIGISVEDTAFPQLGEEGLELSSQRADKFKSPIKTDIFMFSPKMY